MKRNLDFRAISLTLLFTLTFNYILCIATDFLFGWKMYEVWAPLLPGFTWPLSLQGFFIGLVWVVVYSFYLAALIVLPYKLIASRRSI
ncbi:MAG TPA: hypothetical protein VLA32_01380 [Anaerolineales bacterium]|nr:hypothetical protein [Anaerolineales bacterium]